MTPSRKIRALISVSMDEAAVERSLCRQFHIHVEHTMGKGKLIDEIFSEVAEHQLYPANFYHRLSGGDESSHQKTPEQAGIGGTI